MPSAQQHGADVADELPGDAALGALDQEQGRRPRDAAVARRPQRRHPGVQAGPLAVAGRDRPRGRLGRRRRAARQPGRCAAAGRIAGLRRLGDRAGRHRHLAAAHRAGRGGRLVGRLHRRLRHPERPLHPGDPDQGGRPAGRAPRAHLRGHGSGRADQRQLERLLPERVRGRQERRQVPGWNRKDLRGRLARPLQLPLPLDRRGSGGPYGSRLGSLSRGRGSRQDPLLAPARTGRRARHPGPDRSRGTTAIRRCICRAS